MYKKYWGISEFPFENHLDHRFFYHASDHAKALMHLFCAVNNYKGAALVTGEIGCGKTLLSHMLIQDLSPERYQVGIVRKPDLSPIEFLKEILHQIGIQPSTESKTDLLQALEKQITKNKICDKNTVIIIDEAQTIQNEETLEELLNLLNFRLNNQFLLTILLFGQSKFREQIAKIKQFDKHLAIKFHLGPLRQDETSAYIQTRLERVGLKRNIFKEKALHEVYLASKGIPRKINNICDICLLLGFGNRAPEVDTNHVRKAIQAVNETFQDFNSYFNNTSERFQNTTSINNLFCNKIKRKKTFQSLHPQSDQITEPIEDSEWDNSVSLDNETDKKTEAKKSSKNRWQRDTQILYWITPLLLLTVITLWKLNILTSPQQILEIIGTTDIRQGHLSPMPEGQLISDTPPELEKNKRKPTDEQGNQKMEKEVKLQSSPPFLKKQFNSTLRPNAIATRKLLDSINRPTPSPFFVIHVSSHKTKVLADQELKIYRERGFFAQRFRIEIHDKGTFFRVLIGEFTSYQEARRKAVELRSSGLTSYAEVISLPVANLGRPP